MRNSHPVGHCIACHNHRGCAGWNRAWPSQVDHRHSTADTCADDYLTDSARAEALAAQATAGPKDEIELRTSLLGWNAPQWDGIASHRACFRVSGIRKETYMQN